MTAHSRARGPRSYLFVPGNRPERFAKAHAAGADAVILDLEDAVPAAEKAAARTHVSGWLSPERPALVRVNAVGSRWFEDDSALCRMPGVAGVVLPKAESAEDIKILLGRLGESAPSLLLLIETARGMANASTLAKVPGVQRLLFGALDFQFDVGIPGDGEELLYFRSQLILASRLAGIPPPVDGVTATFDDLQQFRADTLRARRMGFGGKLCIHPRQVPVVNECFRPSAEEVAWAKRVLDAAAAAKGAAAAVDGRMVDRPVILRAEEILASAAEPIVIK